MNYAISQSFIYISGFVIVVINMFIVKLFVTCSKFEKRETVNEEIQSKFIKMTVVQFINIAIVVLIVNFGIFDNKLFGVIHFFNGDYKSFDERFYSNIGKTLQTALMLQIVVPQMQKLKDPAIEVVKRWRDRGWKKTEQNEEGEVLTKAVLQEDLNKLYTGSEMASEQIYA